MPFNEKLADRVRRQLKGRRGLLEKQMFGGLAILLRGNMCCGVHGDELIVRLAPEDTDQALSAPGARLFDLTGRPMKGWLLVGPRGTKTAPALRKWVGIAAEYAASLPPKG
ncbi:MAG TPA: TfoX/Sxy family protein [Gemmatimonadales bacterium]|nr:TfoX/Sxy family protein [Gemmatimonadales bacterium]